MDSIYQNPYLVYNKSPSEKRNYQNMIRQVKYLFYFGCSNLIYNFVLIFTHCINDVCK